MTFNEGDATEQGSSHPASIPAARIPAPAPRNPEARAEPRVARGRGGFSAETSPGIGWTPAQLDEMRALGLEINATPRAGAFGRVHGIQYDAVTQTWTGAADPDWEGSARGPRTARGGN